MPQAPQEDLDALWEAAQPITPAGAPAPTPMTPAGPPSLGTTFSLDAPVPQTAMRGNTATAQAPPSVFGKAVQMGLSLVPPALEIGTSVLGRGLAGPGLINRAVGAGVGQAVGTAAATPVTGPPSIRDLVTSGVTGLLGEAAPSLAWRGVKAVASKTPLGRPFAASVTPEGKEALTYLSGVASPAQVTDSHVLGLIENVMQGSIGGGGKYRRFIGQQAAQFRRGQEGILNEFGMDRPTRSEAGKLFQSLTENARASAKGVTDELYKEVDRLGEGVEVPIQPLRDFVHEEMTKQGKLAMRITGGKSASTLKAVDQETAPVVDQAVEGAASDLGVTVDQLRNDPAFSTLATALSNAGLDITTADAPTVSFQQARALRTSFGKLVESASGGKNEQLYGIASQLYKRLDDNMKAVANTDIELGEAFSKASGAYKQLIENFDEGILKDVVQAKPKAVAAKLIGPNAEVEDIEKARKLVGEKAWKAVQSASAERLMTNTDGTLVPGKKLLSRLHTLGPDVVKAAFPDSSGKGLWELARVMDTVQKKTPGGLKVWIQMTQGATLAAAATGKIAPKTAAILLTPIMLTQAVLHPTARKWLTTGLEASTPSQEGGVVLAGGKQLLAWLIKEGLVDPHRPATTPGPAQAILPSAPASGRGGGPGPRAGGPPPTVPDEPLEEVLPATSR